MSRPSATSRPGSRSSRLRAAMAARTADRSAARWQTAGVVWSLFAIMSGAVGILLAHPAELSRNSAAATDQCLEADFLGFSVLLLSFRMRGHQRHGVLQGVA